MADSTNLTGSTNIGISLSNQKALDLNTVVDALSISASVNWTFGTGANQANLLWHDKRSVTEAGENLNLYDGGVLKTAFGTLLTMTALKMVYIKNQDESLTLLVGGATNGVPLFSDDSDILEIPPGGVFFWTCPTAAGIDVTVNKNLKLDVKTTGTIEYDIVLLGLD